MDDFDWFVTNHGSVFTFAPLTDIAREFGVEHFPADSSWGAGYVVEHRFAANIAADLLDNGFSIGPRA